MLSVTALQILSTLPTSQSVHSNLFYHIIERLKIHGRLHVNNRVEQKLH
jgi:hypothetical protein